MRFKPWRLATLVAVSPIAIAALTSGCASPYLSAGHAYVAQGNLPVAIETFDAGLTKSPSDSKMRDALILAMQTHQRDLRRDVDRLVEAQRPLLAVARLVTLEESANRAAHHTLPSEDAASLEAERHKTARQAVDQLERSLDARAERGQDKLADLAVCRQLLSLLGDDPSIARTCERLRNRFKLNVVLEAAPSSRAGTDALFAHLASTMTAKNPELIAIVNRDAGTHNAVMRFFVGNPMVENSDWTMVERDEIHSAVPKRTRKGKLVKETITVPPTAKEIAKARKNKKPAPKAKKVTKQVYEQAHGEFKHWRAMRTVTLPYWIEIENLRDHSLPIAFAGQTQRTSESRYHEYSGDSRIRESKKQTTPYGRRRAPEVASATVLTQQLLQALPARVVTNTLKRVE